MIGSFLTFSVAWYNLPFTLMLVLGVVFAGLQLVGLSQDGDTDADVDADADVDVDGDIDVDADLDADMDLAIHHDIDHDIDHDLDHDVDHDMSHDSISGFSWLAFIGIGKAPLMVVVLIILMTTGLLGWFLNGLALGGLG